MAASGAGVSATGVRRQEGDDVAGSERQLGVAHHLVTVHGRQHVPVELEAGYVAVEGGEGRNEPVDELPADAELVILTMPMGGG